MSSASEKASGRVARSSHHADLRRGVYVLLAEVKQGTSLTFFVGQEPNELIPVESRFYGRDFDSWSTSELIATLGTWEAPTNPRRLTSHTMRGLALSDATTELKLHRNAIRTASVEAPDATIAFVTPDKPAFGYRNVRDYRAAIERCAAAFLYSHAVETGNPKPTVAVAEQLKCDSTKAKNLIAAARREGFLSEAVPGVAGGQVTDKAEKFMKFLIGQTFAVPSTTKSGDRNERSSDRKNVDRSVSSERKTTS